MNNILLNEEIKIKLFSEISTSNDDIIIISAFCKKHVIEELSRYIKSNVNRKRLLVRFQFEDIVSGASDLNIYDVCKKYGWELYFKLDLHVKTYIFDKKRCIIGSANATNRGLGLAIDKVNDELAAFQELEEADYSKICSLFDESIRVSDIIYSKLVECINSKNISRGNNINWNQEILNLFDFKIASLFANDFPVDSKPILNDFYDIIESTYEASDMNKLRFIKSRSYKWLKQVLNAKEKKEIYFGELSYMLHNILIADPPAYRKEVKDLINNLLGWIQNLNIQEIEIDRPSYSQRIKLI